MLKSGRHGLQVYFSIYGYASVSQTIDVTATGTYSASTVQSSYAGSTLSVTGSDISEQAVLKIGGFSGKVLSQSGTTTIFEVPALVTPVTLTAYPQLASTQKITPAAIISDMA